MLKTPSVERWFSPVSESDLIDRVGWESSHKAVVFHSKPSNPRFTPLRPAPLSHSVGTFRSRRQTALQGQVPPTLELVRGGDQRQRASSNLSFSAAEEFKRPSPGTDRAGRRRPFLGALSLSLNISAIARPPEGQHLRTSVPSKDDGSELAAAEQAVLRLHVVDAR